MKATLGLGYEERPEAFDFGVCLQDCRRVLGFDGAGAGAQQQAGGSAATAGRRGAPGRPSAPKPVVSEVKRDFSLKEGETITVNIGGKSRIGKSADTGASGGSGSGGLFAIPPPPGKSGAGGGMPFLPPPPSASDVKSGTTGAGQKQPSAEELGFDDGEFGEFQ